jgi:hypothetical protein
MRYFIDWKPVDFPENIDLTEALTTNTTQIDWKFPINATIFYKISNKIIIEFYQSISFIIFFTKAMIF